MKRNILFIALLLPLSHLSVAQSEPGNKSCSVILLDHEWLIKSYNAGEEIKIAKTSKGIISVHETGDIKDRTYRKDLLPFMIAVLRGTDHTMIMFSENSFKEIEIATIIKKCQAGDRIFVILKDGDKYTLPHHQMEVI